MNHGATTVLAAQIPCRTDDPDRWFSEFQEDQDEAAAACWSRCPLQAQCLAGATARKEPTGVWGGWRFVKGRPSTAVPAKSRPVQPAEPDAPPVPELGATADHVEPLAEPVVPAPARRRYDVDPERVEQAVASVNARMLDSGAGLTYAERNAVIRAVYPGTPRALLAELLGCSERTVDRAGGPSTRIREAAQAAPRRAA